MNAKDVLKTALKANHEILAKYLADLSDADLLVRPVSGANHIAWQLGHLIATETRLVGMIAGGKPPALPAGFAEQHSKTAAASEATTGFRTKAEYLGLYNQVREATLAALANLPETDLERAVTGEVARIAPTVGALFFLAANHEMMHAGQFAVTRRKLGKPIVI
jgi:uncharacterized damage-inducible protein DinB